MNLYPTLQQALRELAEQHHLKDETIQISCAALTVEQAIGNPEEQDYPIQKGREFLVEATFHASRGQAFSCEGGNSLRTIADLCTMKLDTDRNRADFIAALNAVFTHYGLCDRTVHCHDQEPVECAKELPPLIPAGIKVALFGLQPRLLQTLVARDTVRAIDLDPENIGEIRFGTRIEGPEQTDDALEWCDFALITGSCVVNGTLPRFLNIGKPTLFFGTTIAATAAILNLPRFCVCAATDPGRTA